MLSQEVKNLIEAYDGGEEMTAQVELIAQKLEVGENVYALRESLGLNESDFAAILGLTPDEVEKIIEGDFDADPQIALQQIQEAVAHYKDV